MSAYNDAGYGTKSDVIPAKNHVINILFCYAVFILSVCGLLTELFFSISSGFNRLKETEITINGRRNTRLL